MSTTTTEPALPSEAETVCREFARQHPGLNVLRAVACAEEGLITWEQAEGLFRRSLQRALIEVRREVTGRL